MRALRAETRKALTSKVVVWALLLGIAAPVLLAWINGSGTRADLAAGVPGHDDLRVIGAGELLLAAAAAAVVGVVLVGAERVAMPNELGGGRQATTTALAMPSRPRVLVAKTVVAVLLLGALGTVASFGALLAAQAGLGEYAPAMDAARLGQGVAGLGYILLYGLLGVAVTALVGDGLVPLVYLVANQTVISVGYLLTQRWGWAWYLPDTAAMAMMRTPADPAQPGAVVATVVATGWVLVLLALAVVVDRRREP